MPIPQVIFLDAVGTLFHTQGSVGQNYAQFLADYGIQTPKQNLDRAFIKAFKASSEPEFGVIDSPRELADLEKEWWRQVVWQTLAEVLEDRYFPDFDDFFDRVYDYFATASAWSLYPEVLPTLKHWTEQGIQLGVISNFDSRLLNVLQALQLDRFFDSVTLSTQVGVAKPNPIIFQIALHQCSCIAQDAIHVGDQYIDDYQGAICTGLQGRWLNRDRHEDIKLEASQVIESLAQLHWSL